MACKPADGERVLGEWTMNYLPPTGGRYTGKLTVSDRRMCFAATFDTSLRGTLAQLVLVTGAEGYVEIPKSSITAVEAQRSLLRKRVLVTLDDGSRHTFDYGALSVDKVVAAIEQR